MTYTAHKAVSNTQYYITTDILNKNKKCTRMFMRSG